MSKPISTLSGLNEILWKSFRGNWLVWLWLCLVGGFVGILSYQQGYYSGRDELREEKKELERSREEATCTEACVARHRLPATYVNHFKCLCGADHIQTLQRAPAHVTWID